MHRIATRVRRRGGAWDRRLHTDWAVACAVLGAALLAPAARAAEADENEGVAEVVGPVALDGQILHRHHVVVVQEERGHAHGRQLQRNLPADGTNADDQGVAGGTEAPMHLAPSTLALMHLAHRTEHLELELGTLTTCNGGGNV